MEKDEQAIIKFENKLLTILLPAVGGILFLFGLIGFSLSIGRDVPVAIVLLVFALIGAGGIAFGIYKLVMRFKNRYKKEIVDPVATKEEEKN